MKTMKEFEDAMIGVYLASPYTHSSREIREQRYKTITYVSAHLSSLGIPHFTPITQSHVEQVAVPELPPNWSYWKRVDEVMVKKMDELWICLMPGIEKSTGVRAEFQIALDNNKAVRLVTYDKDAGYMLIKVTQWSDVITSLRDHCLINKRVVESHEQ